MAGLQSAKGQVLIALKDALAWIESGMTKVEE